MKPNIASFSKNHGQFGTRPAGMGHAYTGKSHGPESIFHNFASPPELKKLYLKLNQKEKLQTSSYGLAIQNIVKLSFLRLGYIYTHKKNKISPHEHHTGFLSLHKKIKKTFLGLRLTGVYESINQQNAHSLSLDAALHQPLKIGKKTINFGLILNNISYTPHKWSTNIIDQKKITLKGGVNTTILSPYLTINIDAFVKNKQKVDPFLGFEYWITGSTKQANSLIIRAGINTTQKTTGASLYLRGFMFDYAYTKENTPSSQEFHQFSIGLSKHPFTRTIPRKKTLRYEDNEKIFNTMQKKISESQQLNKRNNLNKQEKTRIKENILVKKQKINHELIFSGHLSLIEKTQLNIDAFNKKWLPRINKTLLKSQKKMKIKIPFELICHQKNKTIHLNFTKKEKKLLIKGFIPKSTYLYINNKKVQFKKNKPIDYILNISSTQEINILLIDKKNKS